MINHETLVFLQHNTGTHTRNKETVHPGLMVFPSDWDAPLRLWKVKSLFMLPIRRKGEMPDCREQALVSIPENVNRGGGVGRQTDGGEGIGEREQNSFSLPWGRHSTIPPTVVTESFIYLRGPSVQSVSNSP